MESVKETNCCDKCNEEKGKTFTLIDTGGIEPDSDDIILSQMKNQANIAINIADVIIFLTDIKQGVTAADEEIALMLRKSKKKVVLVCNKADNFGKTAEEYKEESEMVFFQKVCSYCFTKG